MSNKRVSVTAHLSEGYRIDADIRGHQVAIDQPRSSGGTDTGPTPLELFHFSLAGCIGSIARIAAMQQKINLRAMSITVEGDLNPAGLLGKESPDRTGFQSVQISAAIDADLDEEQKQRFLDEVCSRCPLHDNVHYETRISHHLLETGCTA